MTHINVAEYLFKLKRIMSATKHGVELVKHVGKAATKPVNTNWQVGKFKNQLPCISEQTGPIERNLRKVDYTLSHYPRMGLLKDDLGYEKKHVMQVCLF